MIPLLLSLALGTAQAKEGPYMWGAGGGLYTLVFPGGYPLLYPKETGFQATDKVQGDLGLNLRGTIYMDRTWRGAARISLGRGVGDNGNGFGSSAITLEVDKILAGQNGASFFVGGGLGLGTMKFEPDDQGGAELHLKTYNVRAQAGGYYRMEKQAVEIDLFALGVLPHNQIFTSSSGADQDVNLGIYLPVIGVEATYYYGDFKPPKDGKDNHRKNKRKGGKG